METISVRKRFVWIDWMKVIGITLVVFGHFHTSWAKYVYVFHVPLFFLISGMLSKVETDNKVFWKKIWFNLIVPLLIICNVKFFLGNLIHYQGFESLLYNIVILNAKMLLGKIDGVLVTCWFIYTLIFLKILYQYTSRLSIFVSVLFIVASIVIKNELIGYAFDNSLLNVLLAYPFFVMGNIIHPYLGNIGNRQIGKVDLFLLPIALFTVYFLAMINGTVDVCYFSYGNNVIFFIIGSLMGTIFVYEISKMFEHIDKACLRTLSLGTIVILGFHGLFVSHLFSKIVGGQNLLAILFSMIIVLLFVPIIYFVEKHIPYLVGIKRIHDKFIGS